MMMGISALMARISPARSMPVIPGMVWSVMTRSNRDGSSSEKRKSLPAVHPGGDLIAELREDVFTHLHKGFFVIDEEDTLGAGGKLVITDHIGFELFCNLRDIYGERRPFARFALNRNVAVVLLHDAMDDRETQACPFSQPLRRKERIEYPVHDVGRHANARITNQKPHVGPRRNTESLPVEGTTLKSSNFMSRVPPFSLIAWAAFVQRFMRTC